MSIAEIQHAVAELPEHERGALAAWLMESLPPHDAEDVGVEGIEEAARRRQELDSGAVKPMSSDDFWNAINRQRSAWK
jgi:hypothetical protein